MADNVIGHHLAHIRTSRGIADRSCAAADKTDRTMPCSLQMRHRHKGNQMSCMKAVRRRVKAGIKRNLLLSKKFAQPFFIRTLRKKTTFLQYINGIQSITSFLVSPFFHAHARLRSLGFGWCRTR